MIPPNPPHFNLFVFFLKRFFSFYNIGQFFLIQIQHQLFCTITVGNKVSEEEGENKKIENNKNKNIKEAVFFFSAYKQLL